MNRKLVSILILLTLALLVAACGGGEKESQEEPTTPPTPAATHTPEVQIVAPTPIAELGEMTPEELGERTYAICREAIQQVTALLEDQPPAAEVQAPVAELKEAYVQQLVTLGRAREALGRQDQAAADYAFQQAWIEGTKGEWFEAYFEVLADYDEDEAFYQLLNSFNALAPYANFDRLRRELPAEAARLGLEEATETESPTPTPPPAESESGERMDNQTGGYSFQPVAGYVVQESGGTVIMDVDGGDPEHGPAVILVGGPNEGHVSAQAFLDSLLKEADPAQLSDRRAVTVGGAAGEAVDMTSRGGEVEVSSRVVAVLGNGGQQLAIFAFAPVDQWEAFEPLFEQMLASLSFFEPSAEPTPVAAAALGEARRSEYGGFVYRPIQGYEVADEGSMIGIFAPDGDPDTGPGILILSLFDEEVTDLEPLVGALVAEVQVSEQREITVGGVAGLAADVSGADEQGRALALRIVSASPEPTQQFVMIGIAPPERWDGELEPLFEQVLASVSFFELDDD